MKQSIYETADKLTLWGRSYHVIEVLYSERMGEHVYVLKDEQLDDDYEILSEIDLVRFINSSAAKDDSDLDSFFDFIEALSVDDTSDA